MIDAWRALVAYTTCNRVGFVKRCLPHLAHACLSDNRLDLLVALDGDDPETRALCADWEVPLLYSEKREGVGLSKNRVLESFPDYEYYFFLEDDLEVLDGSVFARHVDLMRAGGIHHMSLFNADDGSECVAETSVLGQRVLHFNYGSAEFNAFTREGLQTVGGWHPAFAQFRRWGHTEHSARFPRNALAPAAFNAAVELSGACIRHRPLSVTRWSAEATLDPHGISAFERELMALGLTHVPVETIARYQVSALMPGQAVRLASLVDGRKRYPLLSGSEHRDARADYYVGRYASLAAPLAKARALLVAALIAPRNLALRHAIKTLFLKVARRRTNGKQS